MIASETKATTTLRQYLKWFIIALLIGILTLAVLYQTGLVLIDHHRCSDTYQDKNKLTYVQPFRSYITEGNIKSNDGESISEWVNSMQDVAVKVFDGKTVIYENYYFDYSRTTYQMTGFLHSSKLDYLTTYPITFADGTFNVYINGVQEDRAYFFLLFISTIAGLAVFCIVFLAGITKRAKYITQLKDDMEILGSGDLSHTITIKGNDDLTYIAANLEQMRIALLKHAEEENRLVQANKEIVSKLSHDIRTPVTSLLMFADMLRDRKYRDINQHDHYIERIQISAEHLTELTDQLLKYTKNERPVSSEGGPGQTDLKPLIEQAMEELILRGFKVETDLGSKAVNANIEISAAKRVMDNIISNIMMHGNDKEPVRITCRHNDNKKLILEVSNAYASAENVSTGNGVGLKSIETIMQQADGKVNIITSDNLFKIRLQFDTTTE